MPSPAPTRFRLLATLRRFRGSRRGSAAVEFALVAPMFFALLFAIIESALMFLASQVLESASQNSARVLLTGQAQFRHAHGLRGLRRQHTLLANDVQGLRLQPDPGAV